jgi:hypothetical protein
MQNFEVISDRYKVVGIGRKKLAQNFITKSKIIKFIALGSIIIWAQTKHSKKIKRHDISQNVTLYIATHNSAVTGSSI